MTKQEFEAHIGKQIQEGARHWKITWARRTADPTWVERKRTIQETADAIGVALTDGKVKGYGKGKIEASKDGPIEQMLKASMWPRTPFGF